MCSHQGCSELHGVCGAQRMHSQQSNSPFAHFFGREDFNAGFAECIKISQGLNQPSLIERLFPLKPVERGGAFNPASPPGYDVCVFLEE